MQVTDFSTVVSFVQNHFTDGLVLVVGSGLSSAEGLPGMQALAEHLQERSSVLAGSDSELWRKIATALAAGDGLEAALLKHAPSEALELWIAAETSQLLLPIERAIIQAIVKGERTLRLSEFLRRVLKPTNGLPILTPNYDRLVEVACEMAGFHVDTTALGTYAGGFDHARSCMGSCRGVVTRGRTTVLDHFPRAIVLKPHGSFDWYRNGTEAVRCSVDLDADRLIITPGLNKYRAGYDTPFDKHRELANNHINQSARLLVVGYGFNDDHLQTHLEKRILDGTPTLILTRTASEKARVLTETSPNCVCLSRRSDGPGVSIMKGSDSCEHDGQDLWDLGVLAREILG